MEEASGRDRHDGRLGAVREVQASTGRAVGRHHAVAPGGKKEREKEAIIDFNASSAAVLENIEQCQHKSVQHATGIEQGAREQELEKLQDEIDRQSDEAYEKFVKNEKKKPEP